MTNEEKAREIAAGTIIDGKVITYSEIKYDAAMEMAAWKDEQSSNAVADSETLGATDDEIRSCIGMCLTDANEKRFKDFHTSLKECLSWLEKQGEQKDFVPKVEPKFKVDDWICSEDGTVVGKIESIDKYKIYYDIKFIKPSISYRSCNCEFIDDYYHRLSERDKLMTD